MRTVSVGAEVTALLLRLTVRRVEEDARDESGRNRHNDVALVGGGRPNGTGEASKDPVGRLVPAGILPKVPRLSPPAPLPQHASLAEACAIGTVQSGSARDAAARCSSCLGAVVRTLLYGARKTYWAKMPS